jgi:hypothetical protein
MYTIFLGVHEEDDKVNVLLMFPEFEPMNACREVQHLLACMMDECGFNKRR